MRLLEQVDGRRQRLIEADAELGLVAGRGGNRPARRQDFGREQRRGDRRVPLGEGHQPAHFVGELPQVARPGVEHQVLEHLVVERQAALVLLGGEAAQVVVDQRRDLLAALAERRDPSRTTLRR